MRHQTPVIGSIAWRRIAASVALAALCGCTEEPSPESEPGESVATWTVNDTPSVVIGAQGGPPGTEFAFIQGAVEFRDGSIAIGDQQSHDIRIFSPNGVLLRTLGGNGSGPGEFSYLYTMRLAAGDTIVTFDLSSRRLSWFTQDSFIRSVPFASAKGAHPEIYGPFADGSILQVERPAPVSSAAPEGLVRDSSAFVLYRPDGTLIDTVGWFPDSDKVVRVTRSGQVVRRVTDTPVFGRTRYTAGGLDRFAVARNDSVHVEIFTHSGEPVATVIRPTTPRRVTPEDVSAYEQAITDPSIPAARWQQMTDAIRSVPPAETVPAFTGLIFDQQGNLWVGDYALPGAAPRAYSVFAADGTFRARITVPAVHRILFISDSALLALRRDQDDVPMVVRYAIRRTGTD